MVAVCVECALWQFCLKMVEGFAKNRLIYIRTSFNLDSVIKLRRIFFVIALLCCSTLCFSGLGANPVSIGMNQIKQTDSDLSSYVTNAPVSAAATSVPQENTARLNQDNETNPTEMEEKSAKNAPINDTTSSQTTQGNITILKQDSGTSLKEINYTLVLSPAPSLAQAVKFTVPKSGWNLGYVLVMASDGWNVSSKELPKPLPFTIDIRDANLIMLYHYEGIQLPYFTDSDNKGVRMAIIDVPLIPLSGDFFVCFDGYGAISLAAELENATGNSYYYEGSTNRLYDGDLKTRKNQTIPVNWLMRVRGSNSP
jgi:hypothetical protein